MKAAGFTRVDTAVYDVEEPFQYCAAIVSQPKHERSNSEDQVVTVLCDQPDEGISLSLINDLRQLGFAVSIVKLGGILPVDQDIISTLDLKSRSFENIAEEKFSAFQDLLRHKKSQKMLWLILPTQVNCDNPR